MSDLKIYRGVILDTQATFTMNDLCRACCAEKSLIIEMVAEGIIEPEIQQEPWYFQGYSLVRAKQASRLVRDLGVNLSGVALVLDLLDQLDARSPRRL